MSKRIIQTRVTQRFAIPALMLLLSMVTIGCNQEDPSVGLLEATPTATGNNDELQNGGPFADLTVEEIDAAVSLTAQQKGPMAEAVEKLHATHRERWGLRGGGHKDRGGHGPFEDEPGRMPNGEPPMLTFVENASNILSGEQFVDLAELLKGKLESWRDHRDSLDRIGRGGPGHHGPGAGIRFFGDRLADYLDLTEGQREGARRILETSREEIRSIREAVRAGSIDREAALNRITEIRIGTREQLRGILTDEQWEKVQELRRNRIAKRIDQRIERMEPQLERRASFLARVLDLNSGQADQVTTLLVGSIPERTEILNQVKAGELEFEDAFARIVDLEKEIATEMESVLTPEQLAVWEAIRALIPRHLR